MNPPSFTPVSLRKKEVRREVRDRLKLLSEEERRSRSQALCLALEQIPRFSEAQSIGMFDPLPAEPMADLIWAGRARRYFYPRIHESRLLMVEVSSFGELQKVEGFSFREPPLPAGPLTSGAELSRPTLDVLLVPGMAFTRRGERLGRGGGYYDRLLATLPSTTLKIGVCFDLQIFDSLPVEDHDLPVGLVVTESSVNGPGASPRGQRASYRAG
jgi:5-formyltetrahydrofolate cyclo-ligase